MDFLTLDFAGRAAGVFFATVIVDVAWALYIARVSSKHAHAAARWALALFVLGAGSTYHYAHDWRLIPFAAAGSYLGTFLAVRKGLK